MKFYYISLYYRTSTVTGANKRFDEIGKRLLNYYGDDFICIVSKGERPNWCPEKNIREIFRFINKFGRVRSWYELTIMLRILPKGIIYSDFMPLPLTAKKHLHIQLIHDLRNFHQFRRGGLGALSSSFQKFQLRLADKIVTVSKFTAEEIHKLCLISMDDIIVSYNGIDASVKSEEKNRNIDILYVATFEPRKNHANLLESLQHINRPLTIQFIGQNLGLQESIQSQAEDLQRTTNHSISFLPSVTEDELHDHYCRSKVFCSPSKYEGFGMPLIEAYQFGCVVCCSDIEVFKEVTRGKALYFNPNSVESIANSLSVALSSFEDKLNVEEARRLSNEVVKYYSWDSISSRLIESF